MMFQSAPPVKAATESFPVIVSRHLFQSAPPVKAATPVFSLMSTEHYVSIRAAGEGGDSARTCVLAVRGCFNPRRR